MNTGKCPKCERTLMSVKVESIDIKVGLQSAYKGASFLCPHCHAILSVGVDPLALKADTIDGVVKKLRGYA